MADQQAEETNMAEYANEEKTVQTLVPFNVTEEVNGKNKRVHKGNKPITLFTLRYFSDDMPACKLEEEEIEGGDKRQVVKYADEQLQYLYDALAQRIASTAAARFKAGEAADTSIADILNRAKTGGSTYLADLKAAREACIAYMLESGKKDSFAAKLAKKLDSRVLEDGSSKLKETVRGILTGWAEAKPEEVQQHADIYNRWADALAEEEDWLDDDTEEEEATAEG